MYNICDVWANLSDPIFAVREGRQCIIVGLIGTWRAAFKWEKNALFYSGKLFLLPLLEDRKRQKI